MHLWIDLPLDSRSIPGGCCAPPCNIIFVVHSSAETVAARLMTLLPSQLARRDALMFLDTSAISRELQTARAAIRGEAHPSPIHEGRLGVQAQRP